MIGWIAVVLFVVVWNTQLIGAVVSFVICGYWEFLQL